MLKINCLTSHGCLRKRNSPYSLFCLASVENLLERLACANIYCIEQCKLSSIGPSPFHNFCCQQCPDCRHERGITVTVSLPKLRVAQFDFGSSEERTCHRDWNRNRRFGQDEIFHVSGYSSKLHHILKECTHNRVCSQINWQDTSISLPERRQIETTPPTHSQKLISNQRRQMFNYRILWALQTF